VFASTIVPCVAARLVDVSEHDISYIKSFTYPKGANPGGPVSNFKEISRTLDFNQTVHVRMKQIFAGHPVWGGDLVIHIAKGQSLMKKNGLIATYANPKNTTLTGKVYEDLTKDLMNTPSYIFTENQAKFAMQKAIDMERKEGRVGDISDQTNQLIVYVDDENKAHYAFYLSFYVEARNERPAIPTYILDAQNLKTYLTWNNIKTLTEAVSGGGFGGNIKMGKLSYGTVGGLAKLSIERNPDTKKCSLKNNKVAVSDYRAGEKNVVTFPCEKVNSDHNDLYWDGDADQINGAYSPNNDALYAGNIIDAMYETWYHVSPILGKESKPLIITMVTHSPNIYEDGRGHRRSDPDNAYWDPRKKRMYFGDGETLFYPLTSLGVAAHEISHGFSDQPKNSNLVPMGQSGGIGESFSDMASKAAEFYAHGQNDWQIGPEIVKTKLMTALRDMKDPTSDCKWLLKLGERECSIDKANKFKPKMNPHYSSGVYNRAFYLLATAPGWDTKKAFDVMVSANQNYWGPLTNFYDGACDVVRATKDRGYDMKAVVKAFAGVGISTSTCKGV
jgi:pseudolysin